MKDLFFEFLRGAHAEGTESISVKCRTVKTPRRFRAALACACVVALGIFANAEAAPVLVNGSLDGTIGPDTAPTGWTVANATPDIVAADGPFNKTDVPWTLSPDGGTFVRGNGHHSDPAQFSEAIEQAISGFSVGTTYTLEFFQTNLGFLDFDEWVNRDGHWGLYIDGALVGESTSIGGPATADDAIEWVPADISFTATNPNHTIRLESFTDDGSGIAYMGIDGLQLIDTNVAVEERGVGTLKGSYLR